MRAYVPPALCLETKSGGVITYCPLNWPTLLLQSCYTHADIATHPLGLCLCILLIPICRVTVSKTAGEPSTEVPHSSIPPSIL